MRGRFCYYIFYCHHCTLLIIVGGAAVECVSEYLITDCFLVVCCYCCYMFTGVEFVRGCERPFPGLANPENQDAVDRRQNNKMLRQCPLRHCGVTSVLRSRCPNCCAEQSQRQCP